MATVTATYTRENLTTVALAAEVFQDSGAHCDSELLVIWTDECLATLAAADLDMEELVGATEAIEQAFWDHEQAEERAAYLAQRRGDQDFFDARAKARKTEAA